MKLNFDLAPLPGDILSVIIGQAIVNYSCLPAFYSRLLAALEREQRRSAKPSGRHITVEFELTEDELDIGIVEMLKRRDAFDLLQTKTAAAVRDFFQRIAAVLMDTRGSFKASITSRLA